MTELVSEVLDLLTQIADVEPKKLARRSALGEEFSLDAGVAPIQKASTFFRSIPRENLDELPDPQLDQIKQQALWFLGLIQRFQAFSPSKEDNPAAVRNNLLNEANGAYINVFNALHPYVAFLASKQRDISEVEDQARAAAAFATAEAARLKHLLEVRESEAADILDKVREVAAEQGVSQQAHYFKQEADKHATSASKWQKYTVRTAIGLGVYALATLAFAMIYTPDSPLQAAQIAVSKGLIFAVIAYMLFLCSRTLVGHQHNEVINRHRENALLTFNALVAAAGQEQSRDVVLNHAAGCIFAPQDTGFGKHPQSMGASMQIVEALPRLGAMTAPGSGAHH